MLDITSNESKTVTMSLLFLVTAYFDFPDEFSKTRAYGSALFDQATLMESPSPSPTKPILRAFGIEVSHLCF